MIAATRDLNKVLPELARAASGTTLPLRWLFDTIITSWYRLVGKVMTPMPTPSIEDYLERIYELVKEKGYARVSDIATSLDVQPSSVTRMVQRLDDREYLIYEKYRGLTLTPKGKELGRRIKERHELLEDFLRLLGVKETDVQRDVEGIEHHVSPGTVTAIEHLVRFLQANPQVRDAFLEHRAALAAQAESK